MAQFVLDWSDFSGGYYVGKSDVDQPENTWRGVDVQVSPVDGMLVRTSGFYDDLAAVNYTVPGAYHVSHPVPSEPVSFEDPAAFASYAWWAIYDAAGVKEPRVHIYRDAGPATVTTVDLGSQIPQGNPIVVQYGIVPYIYIPTSDGAIHQIARIDGTTGALVTTVVQDKFSVLCRWGDFMAAASLTSNKMWFSSDFATKFVTWNALDFFLVGDEDPISALVVVRDQLYAGKSGGWWVFTGILDDFSSVALRQLLDGHGPFAAKFQNPRDSKASNMGVSSAFGILYPRAPDGAARRIPVVDPSGQGFWALQGIESRPVNHVKHASNVSGMVSNMPLLPVDGAEALASAWAFASAGSDNADPNLGSVKSGISWMLVGRGWSRVTLPTYATGATTGYTASWCRDFRSLGLASPGYGFLLGTKVVNSTTMTVKSWFHPINNDLPDSFTPVTVELSSKLRARPFQIKQAYIEVSYSARTNPFTSVALTGTGSVALTMTLDGVVDADSRVSTSSSSTFPVTTGADNIPSLKRLIRVAPSDGSIGYEVTPKLTFAGCKIRRLVLICEEETYP